MTTPRAFCLYRTSENSWRGQYYSRFQVEYHRRFAMTAAAFYPYDYRHVAVLAQNQGRHRPEHRHRTHPQFQLHPVHDHHADICRVRPYVGGRGHVDSQYHIHDNRRDTLPAHKLHVGHTRWPATEAATSVSPHRSAIVSHTRSRIIKYASSDYHPYISILFFLVAHNLYIFLSSL